MEAESREYKLELEVVELIEAVDRRMMGSL
jgi:hypothetical protein